MIKKIKFFILGIFLILFLSNKVNAEINTYTEGVGGLTSTSCTSGRCMSSYGFKVGTYYDFSSTAIHGVRITIVDKNSNVKAGPKNFWATQTMKDAVTGGVLLANYSDGKMSGTNVYLSNVGLPYGNLGVVESGVTYSDYISNLTEAQVKAMITELGLSVDGAFNYYLKFEPLYVLKFLCSGNANEYCNDDTYFIGGTSYDILNYGFNSLPNSTVKGFFKYIARDKTTYVGWGGNWTEGGIWNIIKNYALSTYVTTAPSGTNFGVYGGSGCTDISTLKGNSNENVNTVNQMLLNNTCNARASLGVGYLKISEKVSGKIKIYKKNNLGVAVQNAIFTVYENDCSTVITSGTTNASGYVEFELSTGEYCVKETWDSNYYVKNNTEYKVNLQTAGETLNVTNVLSCQYYLDQIVGTDGVATTLAEKQNLIKLYRGEYNTNQGNYSNYNGLLKFSNPSCTNISCNFVDNQYSCTSGWINYNDGTNNFSSTNLSCYNDTITIGTQTYYCFTDFSFRSPIETEIEKVLKYRTLNPFTVHSGRFLFEYGNVNPIIYGYVHKHCFMPDYPKSTQKTYISNLSKTGIAGNYYDYVKEFNWQNKNMTEQNIQDSESSSNAILTYDPPISVASNNAWNVTGNVEDSIGYDWTGDANEYTYVFGKTVGYKFKTIYLKNGSGEYTYTPCNGCKKTAGILTKFTNKSGSKITLDFKIKINNKEYSNEYDCEYNTEQQIITTEGNEHNLELEFRNISILNPFPGKYGNTREKGSNWSILTLDTNGDNIINQTDLDNIKAGTIELNGRYDINGDKVVNATDIDFLEDIIREYITNGNDIYAETILQNSISSSGIDPTTNTKVNPKYTIKLTSKDIRAIREYNKLTTYNDYTLSCTNNGETCYSRFLRSMENGTLEYYNASSGHLEKTWVLSNRLIRN